MVLKFKGLPCTEYHIKDTGITAPFGLWYDAIVHMIQRFFES